MHLCEMHEMKMTGGKEEWKERFGEEWKKVSRRDLEDSCVRGSEQERARRAT